jgi:hypothetical protein
VPPPSTPVSGAHRRELRVNAVRENAGSPGVAAANDNEIVALHASYPLFTRRLILADLQATGMACVLLDLHALFTTRGAR